MNADAKAMALLPKNAHARIEHLERMLGRALTEIAALKAGLQHTVVSIPNPGHVDKILLKYYPGQLSASARARFGDVFPEELWENQLRPLRAKYHIPHDGNEPILVSMRLQPGFCFRVFYRLVVGTQESATQSLGFFENGVAPAE